MLAGEIEADVAKHSAVRIAICNGVSDAPEWRCAGFRFTRVLDYERRLKRLPALASRVGERLRPARKGTHVVTFNAQAEGASPPRASMFFEDGTALHDVLALWSFAGGREVVPYNSRAHGPTADELGFELVESDGVVDFVGRSYGCVRVRPVDRRIRSAFVTYLEIQHVRPLQLKAALLTSVLECLAPINAPKTAQDSKRYEPIVAKLSTLPLLRHMGRRNATPQVERVVVELFRLRNEFLHSGVFPYRDDIAIGEAITSMGRVVRASRILAKLTLMYELGFPDSGFRARRLVTQLGWFFNSGTFLPMQLPRGVGRLPGKLPPDVFKQDE